MANFGAIKKMTTKSDIDQLRKNLIGKGISKPAEYKEAIDILSQEKPDEKDYYQCLLKNKIEGSELENFMSYVENNNPDLKKVADKLNKKYISYQESFADVLQTLKDGTYEAFVSTVLKNHTNLDELKNYLAITDQIPAIATNGKTFINTYTNTLNVWKEIDPSNENRYKTFTSCINKSFVKKGEEDLIDFIKFAYKEKEKPTYDENHILAFINAIDEDNAFYIDYAIFKSRCYKAGISEKAIKDLQKNVKAYIEDLDKEGKHKNLYLKLNLLLNLDNVSLESVNKIDSERKSKKTSEQIEKEQQEKLVGLEELKKEGKNIEKYKCSICGHEGKVNGKGPFDHRIYLKDGKKWKIFSHCNTCSKKKKENPEINDDIENKATE